MARKIEKLSSGFVAKINEKGMYGDGAGLWLQVTPTGSKSWIYRYNMHSKPHALGLGPYPTFTLADARVKAAEMRRQQLSGIDPLEAKIAKRDRAKIDAAKSLTFDECARKYIAAHRDGWRNLKHRSQWENTLKTYVSPIFGSVSVRLIDLSLVLNVLEPIWRTKPETATRIRGRIEAILDWATVNGHRNGDNPARWRGHLDKCLSAPSKLRKVRHHPALPYAELPAFLALLRGLKGISAMALEFTILTAARTDEAIGATWQEFDFTNKIWTVPAERMKHKREHRVPLSDRAISILEKLGSGEGDNFVFPGKKAGAAISNMAMLMLLKRHTNSDLTVHGFRSTFRDWAAEQTTYPSEVIEMCLAHTIRNKVEAAYRRGDLFEKRYQLMRKWDAFIYGNQK